MKRISFFAQAAALLLTVSVFGSCTESVTPDNILGTWNVVKQYYERSERPIDENSGMHGMMSMGGFEYDEEEMPGYVYTYVFNSDNTGVENTYYTMCPPDSAHENAYWDECRKISEFRWSIADDNLKLDYTSGSPRHSDTYEAWLENGELYLSYEGTVEKDSMSVRTKVSMVCRKID